MTIEHIREDIITKGGAEVANRLKNSAIPITELQFEDQKAIMEWMTTQLMVALPESIATGTPVNHLLRKVAEQSGFALTDLYYGLQYAEEVGLLSVHGGDVTRSTH